MAPISKDLVEEDIMLKQEPDEHKLEIKWINALTLIILHLFFPYGAYLFFVRGFFQTIGFQFLWGICSGIGVTAGAHRLWCHRSYKAKLPMRVLLAIFHSMAAETDIYEWSREHRVHHKYTETDADPHNIKRGFFFAHMGWLMCKKHPDVAIKGKTIYLDELMADPVVRLQKMYHFQLCAFFSFYLPTMIPVWLWNESLLVSCASALVRYVCLINITWSVNSFAHLIGDRPFDKNIAASEHRIVAFFSGGEGWHNFHHVFPWDYATSEFGYNLNLSKIFIDTMALLGQAYDLKQATEKEVLGRKLKTGDGTRIEATSYKYSKE